jgi:hypothetical protein
MDYLLTCQLFLKESYIVTGLVKERASFLKITNINDISFFGTCDCRHCKSIINIKSMRETTILN